MSTHEPCWRATGRAGAAFLAAGLASCVTQSGVVVLLPEKDGRDTALTIQQGEDKVVLDRPYGAANLTSWGPRKYELGAEDVVAQGKRWPRSRRGPRRSPCIS